MMESYCGKLLESLSFCFSLVGSWFTWSLELISSLLILSDKEIYVKMLNRLAKPNLAKKDCWRR